MKLTLQIGTTSKRIGLFIADASSNVGAGLTGLVYNSSGLSWYYWREDEGNANATQVTLATATRGTWATGGFIEKDATNLPGAYEIGIPNAALASGAKWVRMLLKGATNMVPLPIEIQLVAYNPDSATDLGLSTLTGNVPQTGDAFLRIGAAGVSLSAIPDLAGVTTLLSRLSATRAGYLDNLSAGAVALQSSLAALITTVGVAGAGLSAADDAVLAAIAALNNLSQANIRTALGMASANLDTQLAAIAGYIDTEVAAIKAKTDNLPSDPADASDIAASFAALNNLAAGAAMTLTAGALTAIADALLDRADAIEVGLTPRGALRLGAAADAGKTSGMDTGAVVIRNAVADSKDRITATCDSDGNRTGVTADVT